jgi:hypothetical protein
MNLMAPSSASRSACDGSIRPEKEALNARSDGEESQWHLDAWLGIEIAWINWDHLKIACRQSKIYVDRGLALRAEL